MAQRVRIPLSILKAIAISIPERYSFALLTLSDGFNYSFSPHHFKRVKISATALVKMVMHTRRGGDLEVMGLMQGKVKGGKMQPEFINGLNSDEIVL